MSLEICKYPVENSPHPPILCVHGILHGAWCFETFWLPYIQEQGFSAYALSLRGHGKSSLDGGMRLLPLARYVDDVALAASKIEAETGKHPVLVGHSMGGGIVQKYLETRTAPGGVLLAGLPPHGAIQATLRVARRMPLAFIENNLRLQLSPMVRTPQQTRWVFFSEDMPDEQLQQYHVQLGEESYRAFLDMLIFNRPRPKRVQAPILVMGGLKDTLFSVAEVQATAKAYDTQAKMYDMAHDMMLEDGWEAVVDDLLSWVSELS